jgi:hypothetical protein
MFEALSLDLKNVAPTLALFQAGLDFEEYVARLLMVFDIERLTHNRRGIHRRVFAKRDRHRRERAGCRRHSAARPAQLPRRARSCRRLDPSRARRLSLLKTPKAVKSLEVWNLPP